MESCRPHLRLLVLALLGVVALAMLGTPPAHAAWQQSSFVIGGWGLGAPGDYGPSLGTDSDNEWTYGRSFRASRAAHLNLLLTRLESSLGSNGTSVDAATQIATAAATGVNLLWETTTYDVPILNTCDLGLDEDQGAHLWGYNYAPVLLCPANDCHSEDSTAAAGIAAGHLADSVNALSCSAPPRLVFVCTFAVCVGSWMQRANPAESPDAVGVEAYFQYAGTSGYDYLRTLRTAQIGSAGRTWWAMSWLWNDYHPEPTDYQLRMMVFAPVASGAKGIVWFGWDSPWRSAPSDFGRAASSPGNEAGLALGYMPNERYWHVRSLNHYVADVLGPVVMGSTWLGRYQGGVDNEFDVDSSEVVTPVSQANVPALYSLGDSHTMAAVFRPTAPDSAYYVLVMNRTSTAITTTVTLKHPGYYYNLGLSPPSSGYVGACAYAPTTATNTRYDGSLGLYLEDVTLTLAPGEGRMLRLDAPSTPSSFAALTTPAGGATWTPGSSQSVAWSGMSSVSVVRLYTDVSRDSLMLAGPHVDLASNVTGSSCSVTLPSLTTTHGWIEVTGTATDGSTARVHNFEPISIVPSTTPARSDWEVFSTNGQLSSAQTLEASGIPTFVTFGDADMDMKVWSLEEGDWSSTSVPPPAREVSGDIIVDKGNTGSGASVVVDTAGTTHIAAVQFAREFKSGTGYFWSDQMYYWRKPAGGSWTSEKLALLGEETGGCSIVLDTIGAPCVTYSAGTLGGNRLKVLRRNGGVWSQYGPGYGIGDNAQAPSLHFDSQGTMWLACLASSGTQLLVQTVPITNTMPTLRLAYSGKFTCVAMEPGANGVMYLAYSRSGGIAENRQVWYRRWSGSGWNTATCIDSTTGSVTGLSMQVVNNSPRLAWTSNGVLKRATLADSTWTVQILDTNHDAQGPLGFTVDAVGNEWFGYWDRVNEAMRMDYVDIVAPAQVTQINTDAGHTTIVAQWNAPGDDGASGTATEYDLRRSSGTITEENFASATQVTTGAPRSSGSLECASITGLVGSHTYYIALKTRDEAGNWSPMSVVAQATTTAGGQDILCVDLESSRGKAVELSTLPAVMELAPPAPNPANGTTTIRWSVPGNAAGIEMDISVYDVLGRHVRTLTREQAKPGRYTAMWDLRDAGGSTVHTGLYYVRYQLGDRRLVNHCIVLR
jgi:hypothetical protein